MRIQASAAKTREVTYGDGSKAMAAVTGRSAAEIEREMNCSRDVVRAWCTCMLAQLSKAETGTARRKSHGAGRDLDWTELVTSHPSELRALADELHRAYEAGETPSQCAGANGFVQAKADVECKIEYSLDGSSTRTFLETISPRERSDNDGGIQKWLNIPSVGRINLKKKKGGCRDAAGKFKSFDFETSDKKVHIFATLQTAA